MDNSTKGLTQEEKKNGMILKASLAEVLTAAHIVKIKVIAPNWTIIPSGQNEIRFAALLAVRTCIVCLDRFNPQRQL